MKSRVHPTYKTKYRVENWAEYARALVQRGDVTIWLAPEGPYRPSRGRQGRFEILRAARTGQDRTRGWHEVGTEWERGADRGLRLQIPPGAQGPTANSTALDSEVVWFLVLNGSRYQSWACTKAAAAYSTLAMRPSAFCKPSSRRRHQLVRQHELEQCESHAATSVQ